MSTTETQMHGGKINQQDSKCQKASLSSPARCKTANGLNHSTAKAKVCTQVQGDTKMNKWVGFLQHSLATPFSGLFIFLRIENQRKDLLLLSYFISIFRNCFFFFFWYLLKITYVAHTLGNILIFMEERKSLPKYYLKFNVFMTLSI